MTIFYNSAGDKFDDKVYCYMKSHAYSLSMPSIRLSSLQSCCENLAAIFSWSYTKLTGISCPSGPRGLTRAIWFGSSPVYCVFNMSQVSRAPSRHADAFHNSKQRRVPLNNSASSPIIHGGESDSHKAFTIFLMAFRARSCTTDNSFSTSPRNPDTFSLGHPVKRPATIVL